TATPEAFNKSWVSAPTVTAGPFKYSSTDVAGSTVTLVPNPKWWGDKPVLAKIVYRAIPPATQLDALANGEVDYIDIGPNATNYQRAKDMAGVTVHVSKAPNYRHMTFGSATAISQNKTIRQAIMMSIDRSTIAKAMIGPIDPTASSLDNHVFVKGLACYTNNAGIYGTQNLQRVNTMLNAAGWKGSPRKNADGVELKLAITIPSGVPTSAQEAQLMQAMLAPAGITLTINTVPLADFFSKYITPGNFEMTVFSWIGTVFPISGATGILTTTGEQNFGKIGSAAIDKLFASANQELDPVKRCALANKADKLVWEEGHSMITYQRPSLSSVLETYGAINVQTARRSRDRNRATRLGDGRRNRLDRVALPREVLRGWGNLGDLCPLCALSHRAQPVLGDDRRPLPESTADHHGLAHPDRDCGVPRALRRPPALRPRLRPCSRRVDHRTGVAVARADTRAG
ncbi:MAG: hypothetical protein EB010_12945, partial [Acidimicrobiia bacterium]|nr:hypothetical protein [Acidimicrobiia bacterium]